MTGRRTTRQLIRVREVIEHLRADPGALEALRAEGLFESEEVDVHEADELRVAVLMLEEFGVNPAGVHVALHLRRRLFAIEARLGEMRGRLPRTTDSDRDPTRRG